MIKYHVIGLLCLAVAAIAGIEAAAQFFEAEVKLHQPWYSSFPGWLMTLLVFGAVYVYFRARKFRKQKVFESKR